MKYDPTKHHRRSIRLKGYDYHNAGAYFVTICTKNRECVLDDPIVKTIITDVWLALPLWFPTIELDEFIIMPNHTHFVVLMAKPGSGWILMSKARSTKVCLKRMRRIPRAERVNTSRCVR